METEVGVVDEIKPLPVPDSPWERVVYILIVALLPAICFSLSSILKPEWQSGQLSDYAALLLLPEVAWFFFPFLVYSTVCLLLLMIAPRRFAARFVVRLGIYTGLLLSVQYALVILVAETGFAVICIVSACLLILIWSSIRKTKSWKTSIGLILFLLLAVFITVVAAGSIVQIPSVAFFVVLAAAPFLCLVISGVTARNLARYYETRISLLSVWSVASLIGWLGAYGLAWRFSILQAIQVYQSLPVALPDCYIASASARGHGRIVCSWPVTLPAGTMLVTQQLQVLKCAELALLALAPRLHRRLRAIYDVIGKTMARWLLTNPFFADLAYLTLKPFEWATRLILKALVPEIDEYARRLYAYQ